jgi:hypothetical protein
MDGAVEAVKRLGKLRRTEVRRRFDARFSALAMARRYLHLYAAVSCPEQVQRKAFA